MTRHIKLFILIFFLLINGIIVHAQETDRRTLNNRVVYTKYTIYDFVKEGSKWAWDLDVVYRRQSLLADGNFGNTWKEPLRFSIRPWIAYQPTKYTRVSFNPIGIFNSAPRYPLEGDLDRPFERELRTTLQINHSSYFKRFNFTHRLRFESRWRGIDDPDGPVHNWRIRYRIRTRIPLNTDYFYTNKTIYISQYSEMHVEFGRNYGLNNLSQNRNYIGIGYRFWDWARVEAGYLHQYNVRANMRDIDLSQGPMFYLFIDYLSKLRLSN
ncbi:MAG TPA: DUF2490 domain-containing protein [Cyclobacteriaceae bacterium]|nr:DUF2490 domain-containing protein [Cyclobacteriaceae bacterium]